MSPAERHVAVKVSLRAEKLKREHGSAVVIDAAGEQTVGVTDELSMEIKRVGRLTRVKEFSDPTSIATANQFKTALLAVRDRIGISPKELSMLKAHCRAPGHTISTSRLAQEIGSPNYSTVNMQYGTLAHHVADALHHTPGPFPDGKTHWWHTLAYGNNGEPIEAEHYEWIMRPELVQALQEMRWA